VGGLEDEGMSSVIMEGTRAFLAAELPALRALT
jgi:hypothetical protein